MSNLSRFFKENVKPAINEKIKISDRFTDEKGNILEWEIRAISNDLDDKLRNDCTEQVKIKKGVYTPKLNTQKYLRKFAAYTVVYPNLNDAELQNSYGVMSAEELISEMLLPGEYNELLEHAQVISGFNKNILEEAIDEAKN